MIDLKFSRPFDMSGRGVIDFPVAALAGLSVAFAAFTIPSDLLADAVGASGLASLFPAAQPPLGITARLAMAVVGALAAFGAAFALLRWLDRFASRPVEAAARAVTYETGPRLNRADSHPDAPPRRPISASRDLGEPVSPRPPEKWLGDPQPPVAAVAQSAPSVARAAPVVAQSAPPASLRDLMARLEHGLANRGAAEAAEPSASAATKSASPVSPAPMAAPPRADDRLQSAIESLQRMAAGGR